MIAGEVATCLYSTTDLNIGDTGNTTDSNNIYYWIPRYAVENNEIIYLYGSSNYIISFNEIDAGDGNSLFGYMIEGSSNSISKSSFSSSLCPFSEDDGLSGMWVTKDTEEYKNFIDLLKD